MAALRWVYDQLESIFLPNGFRLQQFVTNSQCCQEETFAKCDSEVADTTKLLGFQWHRMADSISTLPLEHNIKAKTKREILSSIALHCDLFSFNGPIINRSRLYLHGLQHNKKLQWDDKLHRNCSEGSII